MKRVRSDEEDTRNGCTKSGGQTVDKQVEKKGGERILPCAMPESTPGGEREPPRRTWDRVPQRKIASKCRRKKWVRHWDRASWGGRAEREAPCHCMWHRSGVTAGDRKVRWMREDASTAGKGRHRTKLLIPKVGSGGTRCAVKLLAHEAEASLILL